MITINIEDIIAEITQNIRLVVQEELQKISSNLYPVDNNDIILDLDATAKSLGISTSTLYGLNRNREIAYFKRAGKCFYSKQNILDYIHQGKVKSKYEIECHALDSIFKKNNK